MNKQFSSFQQMLNVGVKSPAFRSFSDWAKTSIEPSIVQEEKAESIEAQPEPIIEKVEEEVLTEPVEPTAQIDLNTAEEIDVVQSLLEKLSDFDWEDVDFTKPIVPKKKQKKELEEPKIVKEAKEPVEEKREPLIEQKVDPEIKREPIPRPEPKPEPKPVSETRENYVDTQKNYKIFRDKNENFECHLSVEGTSLADAQVRIVLESDAWNFVFYGQIYGDGRCVIPIKKGIPLNEGATGNIKLEVIAEDQLFVGWQDMFRVVASKKVNVSIKEQKSIKVSFDHSINEDT